VASLAHLFAFHSTGLSLGHFHNEIAKFIAFFSPFNKIFGHHPPFPQQLDAFNPAVSPYQLLSS